MFRANWVANITRSPSGVPLVTSSPAWPDSSTDRIGCRRPTRCPSSSACTVRIRSQGGIVAWRDDRYTTTRDASILSQKNVVRSIEALPDDNPDEVISKKSSGTSVTRSRLRWIELPALLVRGLVSCVDGRDDSGVVGGPGGDAGELLARLRALEALMRLQTDITRMSFDASWLHDQLVARGDDPPRRAAAHADARRAREGTADP